ncbi:SHOCT domain-containing protein [Cellulomonas edaphi]|uniref:SHOCT domain-containing protein n=1 Tax=Cellulomonas edaphi TaxID=3053468 RepID=A0ABT7S5C4_9CELL|nr:SHOCT domain-containing protein [Cellulomons edaphi]MDM7830781.1 SHOCT domain-containing protein [Cellulomons edaphi]
MGLIGGMARTAVVAGTATAVSNRVSRRQAGRWQAEQQQQVEHDYYQQQQAQPTYAAAPTYAAPPPPPPVAPAPAPAGSSGSDALIEQLQRLGALRDQGILTQAEFDAQKAKLLAG